jgi:hypothetical protein
VDRGIFLVEAYRPVADRDGMRLVGVDGTGVVGVIDIPGDEVALFLIVAADAEAAARAVGHHGVRPIRVVPANWTLAVRSDGGHVREIPDVALSGSREVDGEPKRKETVS